MHLSLAANKTVKENYVESGIKTKQKKKHRKFFIGFAIHSNSIILLENVEDDKFIAISPLVVFRKKKK